MATWWVASAARRTFAGAAVLSVVFAIAAPASAQFGQNKVQHEKFNFQVIKTDHFDIYYYPEEAKPAQDVARMAERWYTRISQVLGAGLTGRQPIILYASHPHFAQTNVIEGFIEEGVGGVTEGLMRRITMPLGATLGETDHVLGHELVHAFQYDMLGLTGGALPLWFIEGMAEYISVGPRDVQTSMFLRDAVIQERVPKINQLDNPRYFPYRFGHAFWAYLGGRFGDDIVGRVLRGVAIEGGPVAGDPLLAIEGETGEKIDDLSDAWREAILAAATPTLQRSSQPEDARIVNERTGSGSLNVGPALSPDGSRVAFLSERDRLSIDLFVADAKTGKIITKLINTAADPHFDSLQFLASAGAWDPEGRHLALGTVRNGRPVLAILDVEKKILPREIEFKELGEIFQPAWSPDGTRIAFTAQAGGVTDLFVYDLTAGALRRLTNDAFADLQPSWSHDAKALVFTTDRFTSDAALLSFKGYRLATISTDGGDIAPLEVPVDGNVTNAQWAANGSMLFFLSDHGGRQNAYRMDLSTREVTMLTNVATGTAGITPLSPALSVSKRGDVAAVTLFRAGGFDLAIIPANTTTPVAADGVDAALLPPVSRPESTIAQLLSHPAEGLTERRVVDPEPSPSGLHLVAIGPQVGLSTTNRFGSYVSGAVSFLFSDTLGNHLLSAGFGVNGGVSDIFTQVQYLNRTSRWNWGVFAERLPFVSGTASQVVTTQNGRPVLIDQVELFRQTDTRTGGTVAYPFSRATRVEFGSSYQNIKFSSEVQRDTYDLSTGAQISSETVNQQAASAMNLYDVSAAVVRDTAVLGPTSPLRGERARVEVAPTFGDLDLVNLTIDYRKYVMPVRPVTLAGRAMHVGRYGRSSENSLLVPLFLGYPTLIRGYDANSFEARECTPTLNGSCPEFDRLFGSRIVVFNGEVRAPLVGLFTGKINYGAVPAEIFGFAETGFAWAAGVMPSRNSNWITSAGVGVRVNMFGFAIAEFNAVRPFDRPLKRWTFVFNLRPGF